MEKISQQPTSSNALFGLISWDDRLNTGHELVDAQHQMLLCLFNRLDRSLINPQPVVIQRAINELLEYARQHFEDEEHCWGKYLRDDESFTLHQQTHKAFETKLTALQANMERQPIEDATASLVAYLQRWLLEHVIKEDMQMADLASEVAKGISVEQAKLQLTNKRLSRQQLMLDTLMDMYSNLNMERLALLKERRQYQMELLKANEQRAQQTITE